MEMVIDVAKDLRIRINEHHKRTGSQPSLDRRCPPINNELLGVLHGSSTVRGRLNLPLAAIRNRSTMTRRNVLPSHRDDFMDVSLFSGWCRNEHMVSS